MSLMVWIKVHIKEGKMDEYMNLHNSSNGRAYTLSQEGCNNIIRSIDTENKNVLLLTCLLYTSPSPRDLSTSRMPSSA